MVQPQPVVAVLARWIGNPQGKQFARMRGLCGGFKLTSQPVAPNQLQRVHMRFKQPTQRHVRLAQQVQQPQ